MVPLVSSFMLSTKEGKKAWVEPVFDPAASHGFRFEDPLEVSPPADEAQIATGTKIGQAMFRCLLTGATISGEYVDEKAQAGRLAVCLLAVVAEGGRKRAYVSPTKGHAEYRGDRR